MWNLFFSLIMTIIASWNVNSIRVRINHVKNFLNKVDPDILLLQEIKCLNDEFPNFFDQSKYSAIINGQKAKYGVAIIHKKKIQRDIESASVNLASVIVEKVVGKTIGKNDIDSISKEN